MKKIIIASILVVGLATGFAYAHGTNGFNMMGNGGHMMDGGGYGMMGNNGHMMGGGYGMMGPQMMGGNFGNGGNGACAGPGWNGNTTWDNEKQQKFLKDTTGLRKEMNEKRFEYWEARRNSETTKDEFTKLEKDMTDIHTKIDEKAKAYR